MFTGLIRHSGRIQQITTNGNAKRFVIACDPEILSRLEAGFSSVAVNGSCHTVENSDRSSFTVFSGFETLQKTTLKSLKRGEQVNLELPLTPEGLLDGHIVQGHVDGIGRVVSITKKREAALYRFEIPSALSHFLVEKDSIAIDGISLTLFDILQSCFSVAVIPESIARTTLARCAAGSEVNIEINIFAKYAACFNKAKNSINDSLEKWILSR